MKIALLVSAIQPHQKESLAITTLNFAKQLKTKGHEVTIISRNKWNQPASEFMGEILFVRTAQFKRFSGYNKLLTFPLSIKKLINNQEIEVLHGFSASPILVLRSLMTKKWCFPQALVIHTLKSYSQNKEIKKIERLVEWLSYRFLNKVDFVTVPTETFAQELVMQGIKKDKIRVIPSHYNEKKFYPQEKKRLKNKYGYDGHKIILNYGSMSEIKGTDCLLRSIPLIIKSIPNLKVILIPRNLDQTKEKYLPLIRELGLDNYIEIIERDVAIEDYVNIADAVVIPYPHLKGTEGNPSCLLEALACGTPVVSTALPELKEIFSDCAVLVEPKDVTSLAQGVISALKKTDIGKIKMGLKSMKHFTIKEVTKQFIELYLEKKQIKPKN